MHVPALLWLKGAGVFISRLVKVDWSLLSLSGVAWWTCMQSVGALRMFQECFNKMPYSQDVVTWTAILGGCVMHGHGKEALKHFEQVCEEGYSQMISLLFVFCQPVAMQF
jgi:pentatricopeptide repeat protein